MRGGQAQNCFPRLLGFRMRSVAGFRAQHFDVVRGKWTHAQGRQKFRSALNNRLPRAPRLGYGVESDHRQLRRQLEPAHVGRADLVGVGGRTSPRTLHPYPVLANLAHGHLGEITNHIRQDVGCGVADLIQHLLGNHGGRHQAARARRFGTDKAAIR